MMTCPYPDCTGRISEGQNFCHTCGRSLDPELVAAAKRSAIGAMTQPTLPTQPYNQPPIVNPPQYPAPYAPTQSLPQYPPPQFPPSQPQPPVQGNWPAPAQLPAQLIVQVPPQQAASRSGSKAPLIIVLIILLGGGILAAGYFALSGKVTSLGGGSPSGPIKAQTFQLKLPVFERDNNYVSDPINGSNGVVRRLTSAALPYSDINHGQTSGMTSMEVALQKGDNPNFTNDSIIMSIYFTTAQGLADKIKHDMDAQYPGAIYSTVVPAKGATYSISDTQGWKLKITVDDVALDKTATLTDGSASPYPVFTTLNLTAEVAPK